MKLRERIAKTLCYRVLNTKDEVIMTTITLTFNRHDEVYILSTRRGTKDVELTSFVKIAPKRYQVGCKTYTSLVAAATVAMDRYLRKRARELQRERDNYLMTAPGGRIRI